jgi:hypothetical protein
MLRVVSSLLLTSLLMIQCNIPSQYRDVHANFMYFKVNERKCNNYQLQYFIGDRNSPASWPPRVNFYIQGYEFRSPDADQSFTCTIYIDTFCTHRYRIDSGTSQITIRGNGNYKTLYSLGFPEDSVAIVVDSGTNTISGRFSFTTVKETITYRYDSIGHRDTLFDTMRITDGAFVMNDSWPDHFP